MKGLRITGAGKLETHETNDVADSVSSAKIKITKTLLGDHDAKLLAYGTRIIPGRFAVGVVVEPGGTGLEKGERVYINPDTPCGACYHCADGDEENCSDIRIAGENRDGFLCDFTLAPAANLFPLPESVSDDDALYIDYISHAVSVFDKLEVDKGDHVVVIGANTFGIIFSLLAIYYQSVPILVDANEDRLALARACGVYYTLNTENDLIGNVSELTGGRMAERVVYIADSELNTAIPFHLASFAGRVAFAGYGSSGNLSVNFAEAMNKQLTVRGVASGFGNTPTSINLIANRAITLTPLHGETVRYADVRQLLKKMAENFTAGVRNPEIVVDMIKF